MIIGGLDPGMTGAVAVYSGMNDELISVVDLPGYKITMSSGAVRSRVDEDALYDLFVFYKTGLDMKLMVIEQVQGYGKQAAAAAFQFGFTYGMIRTTARYAGLQVHDASPGVWKLREKVSKQPDAICKKASAEFPAFKSQFWGKRGAAKHDRAEACFLARYGWRSIWPTLQPREPLRKAIKGLKKA